jgi:hypothetical protein
MDGSEMGVPDTAGESKGTPKGPASTQIGTKGTRKGPHIRSQPPLPLQASIGLSINLPGEGPRDTEGLRQQYLYH